MRSEYFASAAYRVGFGLTLDIAVDPVIKVAQDLVHKIEDAFEINVGESASAAPKASTSASAGPVSMSAPPAGPAPMLALPAGPAPMLALPAGPAPMLAPPAGPPSSNAAGKNSLKMDKKEILIQQGKDQGDYSKVCLKAGVATLAAKKKVDIRIGGVSKPKSYIRLHEKEMNFKVKNVNAKVTNFRVNGKKINLG